MKIMKSYFWIDKTPNEKVIMGWEGCQPGHTDQNQIPGLKMYIMNKA